MRVSRIIETTLSYSTAGADEIRAQLEKIAERHNVSVDELLASAAAAGANGPGYLVRAANLKRRLERLEANE